MGLLDNYTGIGDSPRPTRKHQDTIARITYGIRSQDYYYGFPESVIDDNNLNSEAPDIIIFESDDTSRFPDVIVEITTTRERKVIIKKVKELLAKYPAVQEAFIFDYEKETWARVVQGGELEEDESYSPLLDADLDDYYRW